MEDLQVPLMVKRWHPTQIKKSLNLPQVEMPLFIWGFLLRVSQEYVQHASRSTRSIIIDLYWSILILIFFTCLNSNSCCSACLSRSLCSTSSCSSWGSGGSCLMVTPAGRAPPSWCSRSSSSVSSGWLWCWRPTGLSLGFVIIWGKNKARKTKTERWWCSNVKFISQWNSRMWQIPSNMRAFL